MLTFIIWGVILLSLPVIYVYSLKSKIKKLEDTLETMTKDHKKELTDLKWEHNTKMELINTRLKSKDDLNVVIRNELVDLMTFLSYDEIIGYLRSSGDYFPVPKYRPNDRRVQSAVLHFFKTSVEDSYKYKIILHLFPEIQKFFNGRKLAIDIFDELAHAGDDIFKVQEDLKSYISSTQKLYQYRQKELEQREKELKRHEETLQSEYEKFINNVEIATSNLTMLPYMAALVADYETYGIELLAKQLDWGHNVERAKKVASIRSIRAAAKEMVQKNLEAKYQLSYLLELFPALQDIIDTDYKELSSTITIEDISEYDRTRDWLSKEEYQQLSSVERNQLALDRYKASHNKSKWQIGRDYELYVGYKYSLKGYTIDYFGSYMGLEDLGRDLIAKKGNKVLIIQCKYWSKEKLIHEKHITQLYGTMASYCLEKNLEKENVTGVLVTNTKLSDMAKKMADYLNISYKEDFEKGDYPCIKCNIGHDEYGQTKIYHLPFDQQYDATKIDAPGEFFAMTVKEAEDQGFRRAFKHFNN